MKNSETRLLLSKIKAYVEQLGAVGREMDERLDSVESSIELLEQFCSLPEHLLRLQFELTLQIARMAVANSLVQPALTSEMASMVEVRFQSLMDIAFRNAQTNKPVKGLD